MVRGEGEALHKHVVSTDRAIVLTIGCPPLARFSGALATHVPIHIIVGCRRSRRESNVEIEGYRGRRSSSQPRQEKRMRTDFAPCLGSQVPKSLLAT